MKGLTVSYKYIKSKQYYKFSSELSSCFFLCIFPSREWAQIGAESIYNLIPRACTCDLIKQSNPENDLKAHFAHHKTNVTVNLKIRIHNIFHENPKKTMATVLSNSLKSNTLSSQWTISRSVKVKTKLQIFIEYCRIVSSNHNGSKCS